MGDYYKTHEDKYNPFLSLRKPVVVKVALDLNPSDFQLKTGSVEGINLAIAKIAKDISREYKCTAFAIFNEINIVIKNPQVLSNKNKLESQYVAGLFAQEVFMRYNNLICSTQPVFVSANVFNLYEDKIRSYLFNRQFKGFNNYVFALGSKLFSHNQLKNKKKEEILSIINEISPSLKSIEKSIKHGYTSLEGVEIELNDVGRIAKNELKITTGKTYKLDNINNLTVIKDEIDEDI